MAFKISMELPRDNVEFVKIVVRKGANQVYAESLKRNGDTLDHYIPEIECFECSTYQGDDWDYYSTVEREERNYCHDSTYFEVFYITGLTPRRNDE